MNVTISERSKKILRLLAFGGSFSRADIERAIHETRINTIRELSRLVDEGLVATSGEARATVYTITPKARNVVLWDAEEYLVQEPDKRKALYKSLQPELFRIIKGVIGQVPVEIEKAAQNRRTLGDSVTARKDLERFVIELSWKSSKIEGNTYTLLDTERLIKESQEAIGHSHDEAVMILNHKKAFEYIWKNQNLFKELLSAHVEEVHQLLVAGLHIPIGLREHPVGITGTVYIPPASKVEIAPYLRDISDTVNSIDEPIEKAMACLMLFPYLQPFADGNKRTSRLVANAVLLAHGYPPLSYRSIDELDYKGALILFYEQGTLANFRELYLKQLEESAKSYFFPVGKVDSDN
ncbi:MAG: Fic family protein [Candidatus Levyibacteriota bacterium]